MKSATTPAPTEKATENAASKTQDGPAIATIKTPAYEAKIHQAIAFLPKDDGVGLMKVKPGNRFIVLDMSVRNTAKEEEIDMGQILLSSKVTDDKGREYRFNAMAIAAYTLSNPDPAHQAQYNAMWGKMKPGDFYRTTVFGLEAPASTKNFVISMKEDGDVFKDTKRYEAKFSVE